MYNTQNYMVFEVSYQWIMSLTFNVYRQIDYIGRPVFLNWNKVHLHNDSFERTINHHNIFITYKLSENYSCFDTV